MALIDLALIITVAGFCVTAGLIFVLHVPKETPQMVSKGDECGISLLFRDNLLQHASEAAINVLQLNNDTTDWVDLHQSLKTRFPDFPQTSADTFSTPLTMNAADPSDGAVVKITSIDDCCLVEVIDPTPQSSHDHHQIKTLKAELKTLRLASSTAQHPIWQVDAEGSVIWFNSAYADLYKRMFDEQPDAKRPLFETFSKTRQPMGHVRASLQKTPDDPSLWFDVNAIPIEHGTMCHAMDINAVINAEIAQRNFVQTLAKTFAQLSIGLAIFDRNGQLALFNPALVDLTALPAEFLSARPDLLSFFDRLRDNRVMPEPKNYHSWRQEISEVIAAASDGRYQETWTLDTGQTYRVSGRPHPDGAVAFLIEDISAEISLTRNFRAELEMGQSLMDTFESGLVVFSSAGVLQFCNSAYRDMWKLDPDSSFVDVTILDSVRDWQQQSVPSQTWGEIRDFVLKVGDRAQWTSEVRSPDGSQLQCYVSPIASGATLVRFERLVKSDLPLTQNALGKFVLTED